MNAPTITPPTPGAVARDAHHSPLTPAQRLAHDATTAAEVRAYQTHPDVVALRVDRIRGQVEALMWTGIALGLCFTMTTVQQFAATGAPAGSLGWWAAWWLDPMVSLVLLAVLRAEQLTTRHHVATGPWPRIAKWVLLSATYVMNTWAFWAAGSASGVVLHSVPPLVVVIAAEALTELQYALTTCAQHAAHHPSTPAEQHRPAPVPTSTPTPPTPHEHPVLGAHEHPVLGAGGYRVPVTTSPPGGAREHRGAVPDRASAPAVTTPGAPDGGAVSAPREHRPPGATSGARGRRKLGADYLAQARAAYQPGIAVSPAWVRQVTGCSRGLSPKVAAALATELATTPGTTPGATQIEPERRAAP